MTESKRYSTTTTRLLARASVEREAKRTRAALWVERVIGAFWPVWALLALFVGLVFLEIPSSLPPAWHYALFAGFGAAGLFFLARGALSLRRPSESEALARLDEGVRGRPAQTYSDELTTGAHDRGTAALWSAHQRMLAEKAAALKARAPDLRVSSRDPYALRHGALIALIAGVIAYFGTEAPRLADQFTPGALAAGPAAPVPTVEAWASPPVYTGAQAVYLTRLGPETGPVKLPVGTEISLRVFDVETPPTLTEGVSGSGPAFEDKGAGVYDATFKVTADGAIAVREGDEEMAAWTITATPDSAPSIAFDGAPIPGERGATTLAFTARDDYGVRRADGAVELDAAAAKAIIGADGEDGAASVYPPIELELPLPLTGDNREVAETLVEDLTEHPWAGLPVVFTLRAHDAAGQTGEATLRVTLPARRFTHPMAKALIEQRRAIAFSPAAAPRALDVLEAVMLYPEEVFDDTTAFLTARMAVRRLGYALEDGKLDEETRSIVDLLWKAAIRLEDGDLSSAAERLARAQERLKDAIENGASDDELARLMDELREAMRDYMAELAKEALRDQANGQQQDQQDQQGQQDDQRTITQQDIEKMLQELEEAIKNGQQELARQMLQALQQMMNQMQMAQPGQGQPGQGEQMMNQMGDMIGEQQGLADRSFDQMRRGQQGDPNGERQGGGEQRGQEGDPNGRRGTDPGDNSGRIARDQEALRQLLDQLRGDLPGAVGDEARKSLDDAERAMGDAVDSLEQGDDRQAVDDQVRALDALRDGRRQMGRDMAEAEGRGQGDQAGREGRGADADREDPLGRPTATDGPLDGDSVRVPGAELGKRARELQDEIRRRSGERDRPAEELDYLDRLLDRF